MLEMNYIDDKYEMLSTNLRPWFLVTDFRDGRASTSLKCLQHDENDDKRMLMTSLVVVGRCPPTQTPTQNLKIWFPTSSSQEIGSGLVSLEMIFQALQSEAQILSYSDSSFIRWVPKSKNPSNST